ncbi:MarR family transcriptional regulator [Burkholderia pseudomallei]|uniref:MarR family transcriptional regulator n=1 Tax=Burkholderia pseudomallei TaxID=28450 RepID=UPI0011870BF6|nr:MarR family transcriptional regulator [Burkholderia pseudomallei]
MGYNQRVKWVKGDYVESIRFEVRIVAAGTGSSVWDHPNAGSVVQRFMPPERHHGPMVGIVHLSNVRPTPNVLRDVVVTIGEEVKAGRYGDFSLIVSSEDEATRSVISDIAKSHDVAMFVSTSTVDLAVAEPVGSLTIKDRETLDYVLRIGGTVTATELARQLGVEQTTAGNRLVALHKKGYLQRVNRSHPVGDLFIDPRSVRLTEPERVDVSVASHAPTHQLGS